MAKLTTSQVANRLNVSPYTVRRWYDFWEGLLNSDVKKLNELCQKGMPALPECEKIGNRGDRIWNEEDLGALQEFKNWVPHSRNGVFMNYTKRKERKKK